jgi:hypothetical protein
MADAGSGPSSPELVRRGRERERAFYDEVLRRSSIVAWGDAAGLLPWEDDDGHLLVPVWPDEQTAQRENEGQSEAGEAPVLLSLDDLGVRLEEWRRAEVEAIAVHPLRGHIAATLDLEDFARRLLGADAGREPRLSAAAREGLERHARRLP